jgi:hypothetical protein
LNILIYSNEELNIINQLKAFFMKAIEVTGTIDKKHRLILNEPLPISENIKVRVIILLPEEADIDEKDWLRGATTNPSFDFLNNPKEDIYTQEHGKPFHDEG